MPRLWTQTIEAHRRDVREAITETTADLVSQYGPRSVTMSQIAEQTGIGRATLYKYFPSVESILRAWHERQITHHLDRLAEVQNRDQALGARERLEAVLEAYGLIVRETRRHHDSEVVALVHDDEQLALGQQQLHRMIRELLSEGVREGEIRRDVALDELASYCLNALRAAGAALSGAAVKRLVSVVVAGLGPLGGRARS